jgi:5-methylcytosine-specific restriction endonuclease McrA
MPSVVMSSAIVCTDASVLPGAKGAVSETAPFLHPARVCFLGGVTTVESAGKPSRRIERVIMRTLVLNAGYEPLAVVSFKRALVLVMNDKATVIEHVEEDPVWSARGSYARPAVIILSRYVRVPFARRMPVTRRGVLRRDSHRCGYCGKSAATVDHVLPRSRGGADSWENLVACCLRCNNVKSDRTPQEMGWELRTPLRPPHGTSWSVRGTERGDPRWEPYLELAA